MMGGRKLTGAGGAFGATAGGRRLAALAVALLALPVIVVALLSARAIEDERLAARRALEVRAATFATRTSAALGEAMERMAAAVVADIARRLARADMEPADALRRAALDGLADELVLSEGGRRVFPPEDPAATLLQEQAMMHWLGPVVARLGADGEGEWTRVGATATWVTCRSLAAGRRLCVGLRLERLLPATVMPPAGDGGARLVALVDPWGTLRWSATAGEGGRADDGDAGMSQHEVAASGGLAGWRLRVGLAPEAAGRGGGFILAMLAGVVASGGVLFALMRRQARVAEERQARIEAAARLSHDLRTPLANIRLYLDLIARQAEDLPAVRRACAVAEQEAERLQVIAIDAVRRARGEAEAPVAREPVEADEAVAAQVSRFEAALIQAGCRLHVRLGADGARIVAPGLERMLGNLFDNIRRHAPGSRVDIATTTLDGFFLTRVENREGGPMAGGCGSDDGDGGFGMGLTVARALAEAAGGGLDGAAGAGRGVFTLRLPLAGRPA